MKRIGLVATFGIAVLASVFVMQGSSNASAASCDGTNLNTGTTNSTCVKVAQQKVNQWACPGRALVVDGRYGPLTKGAITAFQADYNVFNANFGASDIRVDGITGPQTWDAFNRYAYWDFVVTPNMGHCIYF
ncbi:MAG: peptidoglycan-binding domain-containing protein [Candidatus Saccharimonadales bacterium]|jgi:peptidoglycan hydrolase-like protein with peptidoglycan-binding domain